jgi:Holliday junction resolvasome RuvABC ATP-dependent DNA helicase subunit
MEHTLTTDYFSHLIGQKKLKAQLGFYLQSFRVTQVLPHCLIVGQRGSGKTEFAVSLARNLRHPALEFKPKPLLTVNCATVKSVRQFVEDICLKYIQSQNVSVLFDECHELPGPVQTAFLTILNPNKRNFNRFRYEDSEIEFDFTKVSFIFATTDPQKLAGPFKDRCRMLHMDDYEYDELASIVKANLDNEMEITDETIDLVSSVCRGNARNAVLIAKDNIVQYLKATSKNVLGLDEWRDLCGILGILPLGLESSELIILKSLAESPNGCSLTNLAAKTGFTRAAIMAEYESYLSKRGLIEIKPGGRHLTPKGAQYLKDIGHCINYAMPEKV